MPSVLTHPLSSSSFSNLVKMFARYGCEPRYIPRFLGVGGICLLRQPVFWYESLKYGNAIQHQALPKSPVFVIGHWRSGTTHLQNLLSMDPQFASVTLREAAMPHDFLTLGKRIQKGFEKSIPEKRLMDNVAVAAGSAWEEELALVSTSPLSFYHVSFFPKGNERIFRDSILFDGNKPELIEQWRRDYLWFLKKVSLVKEQKRFLLKNPANTARIGILLELFPDAKFIHIKRDPYQVFRSTVHLYYEAQKEWGFHRVSRNAIVEHVLATYPLLMEAYTEQAPAIPSDNFAELRFEDLEANPLDTIGKVYQDTGLSGHSEAEPAIKAHLKATEGYVKNPHSLSAEEAALVKNKWSKWFEELGYAT
ncbi:sulfotransferase [Coraliomargarita sinensis]|uniref:Sulfotransferase n=1 Tax=Coraliomargarita sinensis TaxID=2174842 RepID=A0A317ZME1_9BACT|nr:sulfotransferase [Coraliomargarita sinensis]PXA04979.1 sulfotransferase [Coraliomargarita sinensis]